MTNKIQFTKMHGAGNDYIYVNTLIYNIENPEELAQKWSRNHTGIGSDGLILIGYPNSINADYSMRIFNADGSEAMMCGNGTRCVAKYLHDKGITDKTTIRLETKSGIKILQLHLENGVTKSVTVDMGEPTLENKAQFIGHKNLYEGEKLPEGTFVCMGNPHYVIFLENSECSELSDAEVTAIGSKLEHNPAFPERCNIEFAQVMPDGTIRMRVWERGSGITMACGTGACATAVAAAVTKRSGRESSLKMDGGTLQIEWRSDNHIYMTGPAEFVFDGEISIK